jgi:hypothetical protein
MQPSRSVAGTAALTLGLWLALAPAAPAQIAQPAELPPPGYRGQQYVDSRGCLFMRAGQPGNEVWIPRVTRQGVPLCGNPPSGDRVPVAEEGAAPTEATTEAASGEAAGGAGFFVAVGSFKVLANAENAERQLRALNYPVARGRLSGGSDALITIFAGPFASAEDAARVRSALRGQGFPDAMIVGP